MTVKAPKAKSINSVPVTATKAARPAPKAPAATAIAKKSPARKANAAAVASPVAPLASSARNKPLIKRPAKARLQTPMVAAPTILTTAPSDPVGTSKQSQLIAKLTAAPGATIQQMMALTGWQAHTVRGTISGALRKRLGLNVVCAASELGGERLYRIVTSVAA